MMKFRFMIPVALGISLGIAACGPILPKGPDSPRLFTLAPGADEKAVAVAGYTSPFSLQVAGPETAPGLDTDRIALKKGAHENDYFAGARWAGTLSAMVQARMVDAFERSKTVRAVAADTVPFKADYILSTDITDFQAEYKTADVTGPAAPIVRVRLVTRLTHGPLFEIIATNTIEETAEANANNLQEVVAAANRAFDKAVGRVIASTAGHLPKPRK